MDRAGGTGYHLQDPPYRFPFHLFLILALLLGGLFVVSMARAEEPICGEFYTVAPGYDLNRIAVECNTSVPALLAANPGISEGDQLLSGQILRIPSSDPIPDTGPSSTTYTVVSGDTLSQIAARHGISLSSLVQANPQITDPSLIFPGQVVQIPGPGQATASDPVIPDTGAGEQVYTVQRGDTLSRIALRHGIPTANLIQRNTQIADPDLIYPGQLIFIPGDITPPTPLPATPEPQAIEFPTPVPTPTIAPPAPATDIIPVTGETLFQEDFSIPGGWLTGIQDAYHMEYTEGGYRILNHAANSFVSSVRNTNLTDVHVESRAKQAGGPQTGYYGVVCRWQDVSNFYAFVIGSDGFYGIARIQDGQLTLLAEGRTTSGPILLGTATNRVGGSCNRDALTLFVNGQSLLQVQDQTFPSGNPGLVVANRAASGTHVHFNDFYLSK